MLWGWTCVHAVVSEGASLLGEELLPTEVLSGCKLGESKALEPLGSLQTVPDTQVVLSDCWLGDRGDHGPSGLQTGLYSACTEI